MSDNKTHISRRNFLASSAAAVGAFTIAPSSVLGANGQVSPSEKVNVAVVGVGGRGRSCIKMIQDNVNFVAFCDVDDERAAETYEKFPDVKRYKDFRRMLDREHNNIDAVMVATPDHTHAVVSMAAMQLGKHVYCEKPLTHNIEECRAVAKAAKRYGVVTQMGNQGHSKEGARMTVEWIRDGALGNVREVHTWTDRPIWPQSLKRPKDTPPVPGGLDWDLWLGPVEYRAYHPEYLPFKWRGWADFGTGALGDMACHIMDHPYWAFKLDQPVSIEAYAVGGSKESYPEGSAVKYEFPSRGLIPPLTMYWYDGGIKPFLPDLIEPGRTLPKNGVLYVGDKACMVHESHGGTPRLVPETKMREYEQPEKTIPRVPDANHGMDWIDAIKNGTKSCADFEYSTKLTEVVLMGTIAQRVGGKLNWDREQGEFVNAPDANAMLSRQYRRGWSL